LIAACPIALTAFLTKSTSTSDAYLHHQHHSLLTIIAPCIYRERNVLFQFPQKRVDILLVGQTDHDLELFDLDIWGVVVFAEEDAHLVGEDIWPFLEEKVDVPERNPLDFRSRGDEGD
jgi:hypothetical protein